MTASNRASKLESLHKSLKKHFKPVPDPPERSVLEHLLYACCLEDARFEQADEAFAKLQQTYFDWNEVRVTTVAELGDALHSLPFAAQAATRIKQCLQALFESRYQYDIDDMKKANLGKAIAELEAWKGITPFVVSYVSQHALGGHSIPISAIIMEALMQCEIVTPSEAEKKSVPGLERAIPKNKGVEFGSLLQQFAIELQLHPKSAPVQSVLKDLGVTLKPKAKPETKASTKQPAKAEANPAPAPKKPEVAKQEPAPGKAEKPAAKGSDTKGSETKERPAKETSKPTGAKKMTPPAPAKESASKETAGKKSSGDEKKKGESAKEVEKKSAPSKSEAADRKSKSQPKPKAPPEKNKPAPKNTKKGASSGKSSGASIASSITKKKPK